MHVFPGDPAVGLLNHHNYGNGYMVSQVVFGTHTGTHVDAPVHKLKGTKTIDQMTIDQFISRAFVMDVTFLKPNDVLSREMLERFNEQVADVSAIIFKSGWGNHFTEDDFFSSFPGLSEDAVTWLSDHEIGLIGLETPSVHAIKHREIHVLLLEKEIGIVESLANVHLIKSNYVDFYAVPLKLEGLDGSPVRAFAIDND